MPATRLPLRRLGVSLVEALVALAVMAFGMLALVGVQSTMRLNSDLSKQRTEATRIASEEIERLRSFTSVAVVAGQPGVSYDDIESQGPNNYAPPGAIGNTTYAVTRTVTPAPLPLPVPGTQQRQKVAVTVQVQWTDRTNTLQTVTLDSVISRSAPVLGALLAMPIAGSPTNQRGGRHVTIPPEAFNQGNGTSRFVPPGASGVTWYFNNLTGEMTVPSGEDGPRFPASFVSGRVYFDLSAAPSAESPHGPAHNLSAASNPLTLSGALNVSDMQCYAGLATSAPFVTYNCAVRPQSTNGWGGVLSPNPVLADGSAMSFSGTPPPYKVCRMTKAVDNLTTTVDEGSFAANADHPRTYCMEKPGTGTGTPPCTGRPVIGNLINQNFLVISGGQSCPADDSSTQLINGNTQQHQPYPP